MGVAPDLQTLGSIVLCNERCHAKKLFKIAKNEKITKVASFNR